MFVRRSLFVLALAFSLAGFADKPPAAKVPAGPQFLRWAGSNSPAFTSTESRARRSGPAAMTPPLSLDQYTVSLSAVRGESRSVQINYISGIDNQAHLFLSLTTTDPVFAPEIGEI